MPARHSRAPRGWCSVSAASDPGADVHRVAHFRRRSYTMLGDEDCAQVIVDSHCHASQAWYAPVESLLHEMDRNGVERAILIQIAGEYDNSYQLACVRQH